MYFIGSFHMHSFGHMLKDNLEILENFIGHRFTKVTIAALPFLTGHSRDQSEYACAFFNLAEEAEAAKKNRVKGRLWQNDSELQL